MAILSTETHGVDPTMFSLNWFLCVFVDTLPVNTYLHIWDAFLFEGSKVCQWRPETHTKRQAAQLGRLPSLLDDGDKGIEIVHGEEKKCFAND
jgi:hypothetical protein